MDTKKLRQKILDLAIHGKLVPQDPNDEPASVLLERIRAEKERLIAEGKIKRSKKSATSDTSHYENVPQSWVICKLADVCYFESGYAFSSDDYSRSGTPLVRISNIIDSKISLESCVYINSECDKRFHVKKGDLLIAMSGATTGKMGVYDSNETAFLNQRVGNIKVINENVLLNDYRNIFMYSQIDNILELAYGGAQPNISANIICSLPIPIPSIKEQKRIIMAVGKWFSLIDTLETSKEDLQTSIAQAKSKILNLAIHGKLVPQDANDEPASDLLRRINLKAIASCNNPHYENVPFVIPSSWAWCKVRDVADVARGGSPRPIKQYLTESPDGVNWIKIGDAEEGSKYISKTTERIIPDGVKKSRYVKVGDFLLTNSMSFGKPFILKTNGCIHDGWLVISPIDGAYDKNFLYYLLSSSFAYNQFSEKAGGAVVSNLNKDKVADSLFPLPPLAEQKRIASMVEELYSSLEGIASTLQ